MLMVFAHRNRKVINTEVNLRAGYYYDRTDHVVLEE